MSIPESELRMYSHLDAITDGYWLWDLENPSYEYMSPRFWKTLGYYPALMPHSPDSWQSMIHTEDLKRAEAAFQPHLDDGTPYHLLVRYRHKNGHWVWIVCRGQAQFDSSGKPTRMLGAHQDVTTVVERNVSLGEAAGLKESSEAMLKSMEKIIMALEEEL